MTHVDALNLIVKHSTPVQVLAMSIKNLQHLGVIHSHRLV